MATTDPNLTSNTTPLSFRPPSTSTTTLQLQKSPNSFTPPPIQFLTGLWHVTHSTLPMWKSNKNVKITYTPLSSPPGAIDDLVTYQPLTDSTNTKLKTVKGVDKPHETIAAAYKWRGKGLLMVASSQWEVLGYGEEEGGWVVTYFAKTVFTPAGIDIYARRSGGLSEGLLGRIKEGVREVGGQDGGFRKLVDEMFVIKHDW